VVVYDSAGPVHQRREELDSILRQNGMVPFLNLKAQYQSLPMHPELTSDEIEEVVHGVRGFYQGKARRGGR
jgi:hypothetical protein